VLTRGGPGLEFFWPRVQKARDRQQRERDRRGDCQCGRVVVIAGRDDQGDEQWTEHRSKLVQGLVDAESPAVTHLSGGVREHRVTRRVARRLTHAFEDDEQGRHLPAAGKREQRHDRHLQEVAPNRDRPVQAGPVGAAPGEQAQAVSQQFAEPGHPADGQGPGAEQPQVLTDAPRALVGEVGEEAHHPNHHHELDRRRESRRSAGTRCTAGTQFITGVRLCRLHRSSVGVLSLDQRPSARRRLRAEPHRASTHHTPEA
jgi:hypothetical protein